MFVSVNGGAYKFKAKDDSSLKNNKEFTDVSKIIREAGDKFTIIFAAENSADSQNYVISMELKEEYAKQLGKGNKNAENFLSYLAMFKYKFWIDRKTNLIMKIDMKSNKDFAGDSTMKMSDYRKVPGTIFYYPYTMETVTNMGDPTEKPMTGVTKVQSFQVMKSKDVASYFVITAAAANAVALSTESSKSDPDDGNFGKELGKAAEDTAKDEVKNQVKQGVRKGIGGVLKGLGGF